MKPTDFIPEKHSLGQAAMNMHVDHEIQMAREECYHAATNAMELHRMLKQVSEEEGLQAWASEKITLANDYLRTVKEWLEYEIMTKMQQESGPVTVSNPMTSISASLPAVTATGPEILETEFEEDQPVGNPPTEEFYLTKNGSALKDRSGKLMLFKDRDAAQKAIDTLKSRPHNAGKDIRAVGKVKETASAGASSSGVMSGISAVGPSGPAGSLFGGKQKINKRTAK